MPDPTFIDRRIALSVVVSVSTILFFLLTMIAENKEKKEIKTILVNLQDNSNELIVCFKTSPISLLSVSEMPNLSIPGIVR